MDKRKLKPIATDERTLEEIDLENLLEIVKNSMKEAQPHPVNQPGEGEGLRKMPLLIRLINSVIKQAPTMLMIKSW